MLKRENKEVSVSFKRWGAVWTRDTLCEDYLDATMEICCVPCSLLKNLTVEGREAKVVLVALSIGIYLRQRETWNEAMSTYGNSSL